MIQFKKTLFVFLAIALSGMISLEASGTTAEAKSLVKNAIRDFQANGSGKTFSEISKKNGKYVKEDLYIMVIDMSGLSLNTLVLS